MQNTGRYWPLVLPAAYLLHLAEESWAGPGLVAWAAHHLSPGFTTARFVAINAVAWPTMLLASLAAVRVRGAGWLVIPLAFVVLINGVVHVVSTVVTAAYAPGVVTGVLLYVPLGMACLRRASRTAGSGQVAAGLALGAAAQALVAIVAFGMGQ